VHLARLAVLIIVASLISFSIGRSDAPSPSPTQKSSPPPELERLLDALVGRWSIKELKTVSMIHAARLSK